MKPFAEACERNREPILKRLKEIFRERREVLEIGSGTGQHAVYFAKAMPHLVRRASDRLENHPGIRMWLQEAALDNLSGPLELDVCQKVWPPLAADAAFSANTAHIMDWGAVEAMFRGIGNMLPSSGRFALYGPFNYDGGNYDGRYTSQSNAQFDQWLQARDPRSGIRDFEALDRLAKENGMRPIADYEMPANNRLLCWDKRVPEDPAGS